MYLPSLLLGTGVSLVRQKRILVFKKLTSIGGAKVINVFKFSVRNVRGAGSV